MHIVRGSTYRDVLRWATSEVRLRPVSVTPGAPIRFTVEGHDLPDGWTVQVEGHQSFEPKVRHRVRAVDANTLELPAENGAQYRTGSAVLRWNVPVDLAGYTARMQVKDKVGGTVLLELTTENGGVVIDNDARTITRLITAADTATIAWKKGVYDLEMVSGDYVVKLDSGTVTVGDEVTV